MNTVSCKICAISPANCSTHSPYFGAAGGGGFTSISSYQIASPTKAQVLRDLRVLIDRAAAKSQWYEVRDLAQAAQLIADWENAG